MRVLMLQEVLRQHGLKPSKATGKELLLLKNGYIACIKDELLIQKFIDNQTVESYFINWIDLKTIKKIIYQPTYSFNEFSGNYENPEILLSRFIHVSENSSYNITMNSLWLICPEVVELLSPIVNCLKSEHNDLECSRNFVLPKTPEPIKKQIIKRPSIGSGRMLIEWNEENNYWQELFTKRKVLK